MNDTSPQTAKLKKISQQELTEKLEEYERWISSRTEGKFDFRNYDLTGLSIENKKLRDGSLKTLCRLRLHEDREKFIC